MEDQDSLLNSSVNQFIYTSVHLSLFVYVEATDSDNTSVSRCCTKKTLPSLNVVIYRKGEKALHY